MSVTHAHAGWLRLCSQHGLVLPNMQMGVSKKHIYHDIRPRCKVYSRHLRQLASAACGSLEQPATWEDEELHHVTEKSSLLGIPQAHKLTS